MKEGRLRAALSSLSTGARIAGRVTMFFSGRYKRSWGVNAAVLVSEEADW